MNNTPKLNAISGAAQNRSPVVRSRKTRRKPRCHKELSTSAAESELCYPQSKRQRMRGKLRKRIHRVCHKTKRRLQNRHEIPCVDCGQQKLDTERNK